MEEGRLVVGTLGVWWRVGKLEGRHVGITCCVNCIHRL